MVVCGQFYDLYPYNGDGISTCVLLHSDNKVSRPALNFFVLLLLCKNTHTYDTHMVLLVTPCWKVESGLISNRSHRDLTRRTRV